MGGRFGAVKLTPEKLTAFCAALAETAIVGKACKAVGISRQTAYEWRNEIPAFAEAWDRALKVGVSALEDEAHRRAFEGTDKPLVHQGQFTYEYETDELGNVVWDTIQVEQPDGEGGVKLVDQKFPRKRLDENGRPIVATVKEYSDTLAIFLLKAHAPDKYRERTSAEISGPGGGPVQTLIATGVPETTPSADDIC